MSYIHSSKQPYSDVHLQAILLLADCLTIYSSRRASDKSYRFEHQSAQDQKTQEVVRNLRNKGIFELVTGIASGLLSIGSGFSCAISPAIISKVMGVPADAAATDKQRNIADTIQKVLQALSQGSDTTGRVADTFLDSKRYEIQGEESLNRTGYEEDTRRIQEHRDAEESLKRAIDEFLRTAHASAQSASGA